MEIKLETNINSKMLNLSKELRHKVIAKSHARSLKRSIPTSKKVISSSIRDELNIKVRDAKAIVEAKIKGDYYRDRHLEVVVKDNATPMSKFSPRGKKAQKKFVGVNVSIKKGKGKKFLKGAFIGKSRIFKGQDAVFATGKKASPYPIKELFTSTGANVASNENTKRKIISSVREKYLKEFEHNTKFYLNKLIKSILK